MYVHNTKLTMYKYALREFGHGLSTWLLMTKVCWEKSLANLVNFTKLPKLFAKILHFNYYYQYYLISPNWYFYIFSQPFSHQNFVLYSIILYRGCVYLKYVCITLLSKLVELPIIHAGLLFPCMFPSFPDIMVSPQCITWKYCSLLITNNLAIKCICSSTINV